MSQGTAKNTIIIKNKIKKKRRGVESKQNEVPRVPRQRSEHFWSSEDLEDAS